MVYLIDPYAGTHAVKKTDHHAEARGSNIVDSEGQTGSGRPDEGRDATPTVTDHVSDEREGIYSASSDSIVYPESVAEKLEAATRIVDHHPSSGTPNDIIEQLLKQVRQGISPRLIIKNQGHDLPLKDGVYEMGEPMISPPQDSFTPQVEFPDSKIVPADKVDNGNDPVNHPSHYTAYPGIEIIQLTRRMTFNRGNAVKYIARAGLKDPSKEIEDLEKARFYIDDEIKLLKGEFD